MRYVPASTKETAFSCPHCDALAHQAWHSTFAERQNFKLPEIIDNDELFRMRLSAGLDKSGRIDLPRAELMATGVPLKFKHGRRSHDCSEVINVWLSECFNCRNVSIWVCDRLIYPQRGRAPTASADMPNEIRHDYDEASAILDLSPRGSAALLRLAIQKLCRFLGQPGENINDDIKALVKGGLDPRIQKALDAVRVIGNNAVHPGQIDLQDDRAMAESLFRLLNLIVEKIISEPKHVDEVYASLPEGARKAIEKRDGKTN